jgi:hypothetical protein
VADEAVLNKVLYMKRKKTLKTSPYFWKLDNYLEQFLLFENVLFSTG